jgi:uncharacterized cupin superfamily protein
MKRGRALRSPNGRFAAIMQYDGNFVVYDNGRAKWASGTVDKGDRVAMQEDGNLVIYQGWSATWHTDTRGRNAALTM